MTRRLTRAPEMIRSLSSNVMSVKILGTEFGLTLSHKTLRAQIEQIGWTVGKIHFDSKLDRYTAEAKSPSGEKLSRNGKTERLALSNLLITITHRNSHVATKLSSWQTTFTNQIAQIAEAYMKAPIYEPKASAAFMELAKDCERRSDVLSQHLQIQVVNDPEPYKDAQKLSDDVKKKRRLMVSRAGADHPIWSEAQVVQYRICHDVLGYVAAHAGWDWPGENLAFSHHAELLSSESQKALFSESIARTAYITHFRAYGEQKVSLFPSFMDKAQKSENPHDKYPGLHPSQTTPAVPAPRVKPIVESSLRLAGADDSWALQHLAVLGDGTVNPNLQDPNSGWQSAYADDPLQDSNGLTLAQSYGDPIEADKTSANANLINTNNSPSTNGQEWAYLNQNDPGQLATMKRAIVNAFRVVLLSPRKDLRWNAVHYQDISHIPAEVDDPAVYWNTLEKSRQDWNVARGFDQYGHIPYMKMIPNLVNVLYQQRPNAGYQDAQKRTATMIHDWLTEEQNKLMREDADKPEEKRREGFQIETKANYNLTARIKLYLEESKPNLDHGMTKDLRKQIKTDPMDMDQFIPITAATGPEDLLLDKAKYGAFMGGHLKSIASISQHADDLLKAALQDVHEHDGTGHHFRAVVLQLGVPGVGPKVCSFAWLLLQPMTSELGTIDTHMMDLLGHKEKEMNNRDYFGMERQLQAGRDAAGYSHVPLGQFQWGCFVPGTLVRTRSGFRAIEDIEAGEEVLTAQGNWKPVRKTMSRQFDGELVQLTTNASARPILTTIEHPFLTLKGQHKETRTTLCRPGACADHGRDPISHHHLDWTHAEDLRVGDWFPLTTSLEISDIDVMQAPDQKRSFGPREFELTSDFLWLCGLYIAEGSCEENRVEWGLNGEELEYQDRIIDFAKKHGYGHDLKVIPGPNGGGCRVRINSRVLAQWFPTIFGSGSHNKRIPDEMMQLPADKLRHLAQGIFDGDGKKATNAIEQTSLILALQLVEVAARLGVQPTTSRYLAANSTYISDVYRVHELVTTQRSVRSKPDVWKLGDWDLRKITAIDRVEYHGPVFNLSIENDETYVIENVPVHNCWDYKRTGAGVHQDHSAMAVLDPKPHDSIDWAAKEQPVGAVGAVEWKNMWQTNPPEWWAATKDARDEAWDDFRANQANKVSKNNVPWNNVPADYDPSVLDDTDSSSATLSSAWGPSEEGYYASPLDAKIAQRVPWFIHPQSNERLVGQPGQSLMSHLTGSLNMSPTDVWATMPDEAVGKL